MDGLEKEFVVAGKLVIPWNLTDHPPVDKMWRILTGLCELKSHEM